MPEIPRKLIANLMDWFDEHRREMPWRGSENPYHIWVSEMMLQQTQVSTVKKYFHKWIVRFPDVFTLAEAPLEDVLKVWEGLGYYTRARNFHKGAKYLSEHSGSRDDPFPHDYHDWLKVPGVGPYTAAAVSSIAFRYPAAVLDANVLRVAARIFCLDKDTASPVLRRELFECLSQCFYEFHPGWVNQAWMELGSLLCRSRPLCESCPIREYCCANKRNATQAFPVKKNKNPVPVRCGAAFVIRQNGRFLMLRRPETGFLGGLWEFPAFTQKKAAFDAAHFRKFLQAHHLIITDKNYVTVRQSYTHFHQVMRVYDATIEKYWEDPGWTDQCWVGTEEAKMLPRSALAIKIGKLMFNN
jgi:A/G-specific adenine glycosylase